MNNIKQSTLFPIEGAFKVITRRSDAILQKIIGCKRREVWVLLCVDDVQLSQNEIGKMVGLHPNVIGKLLERMEERGLLRRTSSPCDHREKIVRATPEGKKRLKTYLDQRPAVLLNVFSPLTAVQIEQWRDLAVLVLRNEIPSGEHDDTE